MSVLWMAHPDSWQRVETDFVAVAAGRGELRLEVPAGANPSALIDLLGVLDSPRRP
jgi:hypothetical protein